jgi:hypothetical protein
MLGTELKSKHLFQYGFEAISSSGAKLNNNPLGSAVRREIIDIFFSGLEANN